jgi:hypothetical protein
MQGVHKGVCTQLARYIRQVREVDIAALLEENPRRGRDSFHKSRGLYVVHCVCHRLALILTDAIKGSKACDKVIPDECIRLLTSLYKYFAKSPARKSRLRELIDSVNQRRAGEAAPARDNNNLAVLNPHDELENVLTQLEERHKLPRRIVLTRWLSSADAIRVCLSCRDTYCMFFEGETHEAGVAISDMLQDNTIIAWYACLQDVLPVITGMNILFQSKLPLPHLLYGRVTTAKSILINMIGQGGTRGSLISFEEVDLSTRFGAFANKFIWENSERRCKSHGMSLMPNEILQLKQEWHKLYKHCLDQIDARFPPTSMMMFQLLQVIDPAKTCGPIATRINNIAGEDVTHAVAKLLLIFELPLIAAGRYSPEEIINSFTAFRAMETSVELWAAYSKQASKKTFDHSVIYTYYKELIDTPELAAWSFFSLFLLVLPTGNAVSERGFSAEGATHTKSRSELSHDQVFANMMIGFNGPGTEIFGAALERDSKALGRNWWGFIPPNNFNADNE